MEIKYPILQIVGYQNSGKTTLVEKIVQEGTLLGLQMATIKHHGHSTPVDSVSQQKDSSRHRRAGAVVASVEGGGSIQLEATSTNQWSLDRLLKLYTFFEHDMILVEGYKKADYPKIVVIKEPEDTSLLSELTNIIAVVSRVPVECSFPIYNSRDVEQFIKWLFRGRED